MKIKRVTREMILDGNYTMQDLLKDLGTSTSHTAKIDFYTYDLIIEDPRNLEESK